VASSVISRPTNVAVKFNAIVKINKYKELHERHHFILMAMEVHGAFKCDMDRFIKDCALFFHVKQSRGHLSLSFFIQFFKLHVNIVLQHVLISTIEKKIVLTGDACYKPPIIIRSHDLHAGNIRRVVGEITSYHKRD